MHMRYSVGQKLWTIGLELVSKKTGRTVNSFGFTAPNPELFEISKLFFNELTVTEHHRVPGEWSDDVQYDGFILNDSEGRVWHNQYPRASYGQISDTCDGLFKTPLMEQLLAEQKASGAAVDWDSLCQQFTQKNQTPFKQYSLTRFMDDLAGGILDKDGKIEYEQYPVWPQLAEIRDRVVKAFFEATGKTLEPYIQNLGSVNDAIAFRSWRVVD